jgi:hypothetical protein
MMMYDYNPWTSLFLIQAFRMCKPACASNRTCRRQDIAQAELLKAANETVVRRTKAPAPAPRAKPVQPRRGWRHAFRTGPAGADPTLAVSAHDEIAA